jgi:hypothetical protein
MAVVLMAGVVVFLCINTGNQLKKEKASCGKR